MTNEDFNMKELAPKIKKYSIGIGACALAFAVLALVVTNADEKEEITTAPATTQIADVEATVTGVPDERKETVIVPATHMTTTSVISQTTEATTAQREAPASYSLPLGTDIGNDYSRGVPVYSEVMGDWRTHDGVDFNGQYGDGVKAVADGIVREVKTDALMGDIVVIDHGGGVVATYCGVTAEKNLIKGIIVSANDKIGELSVIPCEADAEFPHLHLEIEVDGELCDPMEVMGYFG